MRTAIFALAAFGCTALLAQDPPKGDAELLRSSWDWDPAAKQSDAEPVVLLERIVIKDNILTFHYSLDGKTFTTPTEFTLESTANPKTIDFSPTDKNNDNRGKAYLGIYELKAGQLKIGYRGPGSTRPKDFDDKQDRKTNALTTFIQLKPTLKG
jgi:uncharacterized protein (TIGR03067 family)